MVIKNNNINYRILNYHKPPNNSECKASLPGYCKLCGQRLYVIKKTNIAVCNNPSCSNTEGLLIS